MNIKLKTKNCLFALFFLTVSSCLVMAEEHGHGHDEEGHEDHEESKKGPRGGRLLVKDDYALEVTIFEDGVPPEFRVFLYEDGKILPPGSASVEIVLTRFGGVKQTFKFSPKEEFLVSDAEVTEPHSFDVLVKAKFKDTETSWEYESYEGRTVFSATALKAASLSIDVAGPQKISNNFAVYGRILPNEDRTAHISARFPGLLKEVRKKLGDLVKKGEVLAVIESNQSLQPYEIKALSDGEVVAKHGALGEFVGESDELFTVTDLSTVWADFQVYRDEFGAILKGEKIKINIGAGQASIEATVSYVSPLTDETTQSKLIRAEIPNSSGSLRPGLFVSGELTASEVQVPLAVRVEAIQTFRDWKVVYLTNGHIFQAIPVELGRKDSHYIEVLSGIKAGDKYASENSFIVKADVEKSGASHDH